MGNDKTLYQLIERLTQLTKVIQRQLYHVFHNISFAYLIICIPHANWTRQPNFQKKKSRSKCGTAADNVIRWLAVEIELDWTELHWIGLDWRCGTPLGHWFLDGLVTIFMQWIFMADFFKWILAIWMANGTLSLIFEYISSELDATVLVSTWT